MSDDAIEKLLKSLHIQKGGVPGISKDAPANDSYYLRCEHMDFETEIESLHLTNYDKEVKDLLKQIRKFIDTEIIGKDNYITKFSGNSRFDQQVHLEINGENKLRKEQRKLNQEET